MFSPSKKPKRSLESEDEVEECPLEDTHAKKVKRTCDENVNEECSVEDSTPIKKQKCTSASFITSSPAPCSLKEHKKESISPSESFSIPNPSIIDEQEQESASAFFSRTFTYHQQKEDSDTASEDEGVIVHGSEIQLNVCTTIAIEVNSSGQESQVGTWCGTTVSEEIEELEEEYAEFNPYLFIKNLPAHQPAIRTLLPPRLPTDPKLCLVLDLDETLVHCSTEVLLPADLIFPVVFNSIEYTVFARKRPYIEEFLSQMAALFEIVVFTASQEVYADRLLNILDPERKYIRHRLFRDSCICVEGNYLKDLTILGRDLSKVVIVDNSPQAFGYQVDNGIPIESWFDDEADQELLRLVPFLESIVGEPDVRPIIREKYKLHELISRS